MLTQDRTTTLALQEFQLRAVDADGTVARIVASSYGGLEPAVPLLTSVDDRHDVATLRAVHPGEPTQAEAAQRAALDPYVSKWQPLREYRPRISERSQDPPTYYRLAVTESGINNMVSDAPARPPPGAQADAASTPHALLWIGVPLETYAGMMILLGSHENREKQGPDARDWPLPLSRDLGVRIYESQG